VCGGVSASVVAMVGLDQLSKWDEVTVGTRRPVNKGGTCPSRVGTGVRRLAAQAQGGERCKQEHHGHAHGCLPLYYFCGRARSLAE